MSKRPRLSRDDWADAALKAMSHGGLSAVAVEPLARELAVTKGSFYWHFKSRDELIEAALARWEEVGTAAILAAMEDLDDPRERLVALFQAAFASGRMGSVLIHLGADADSELVGPVLERVTFERLALIRDAFAACGMERDEAASRALLCYTAYVGTFQVRLAAPDLKVDADGYLRHLIATLLPRP